MNILKALREAWAKPDMREIDRATEDLRVQITRLTEAADKLESVNATFSERLLSLVDEAMRDDRLHGV